MEIEKLNALALAATPGPWEWVENATGKGTQGGIKARHNASVCDFGDAEKYYPTEGMEPSAADAAYIVAANPATVLALIAEVERLRAAIAGAEKDAERYRWIESKANRDSRDGGWWGYYVLPMLDGWSHARGKDSFDYKTLSEAIDAAIEAHTTARKEPQ